jgi:SAM-dependent methyltransferase
VEDGGRSRQELDVLGRSGFGDGDTYDAGRPDYPDDVVEHLVAAFGIGPGSAVVDLGAGTGKLTGQLLAHGPSITAVEPSAAMRARFARNLPGVPVLDGDDQHIPLPDGFADALFVAQAFHWFDPVPALAEIGRVVRPGGGLGLVWNELDDDVGWVADLTAAVQWRRRRPYRPEQDFRPVIALGPFERTERRVSAHRQVLDHAGLRQRIGSISYLTVMEAGQRAALLAAADAVIDALPEPVAVPYVTRAYTAVRRPVGTDAGEGRP